MEEENNKNFENALNLFEEKEKALDAQSENNFKKLVREMEKQNKENLEKLRQQLKSQKGEDGKDETKIWNNLVKRLKDNRAKDYQKL